MSDAPAASSARRLELAVTAANIGLFDWDLRNNTVWYSPEWKRQLGYDADELSNAYSEWEDRIHPDDRASATAMVRAYLEAPWPDFRSEVRLRHRNGSYRWILTLAALEHDDAGVPIRVLGSHIDITDRKNAELAVTSLMHFDQDVLDSLSSRICVVDASGVILAVNRAWVEYSTSSGAAIDRTGVGIDYFAVCDAAAGNDWAVAQQIKDGIRGVIDGRLSEFAAEYTCTLPDGPLWFELRVSPFGGGGAGRAVVSHLDITRIKVAEEALRLSESRLASAQALARVGSWHLSRDLTGTSGSQWSAEMFRLLDLDPADGVPTLEQFAELIHPDDRPQIGEQIDAAAEGRASTIEFRSNPAHGPEMVFSGSVKPVTDAAGEVVAFEGTLHDISDRHRAAQMQARLREQLADAQRLEAVGRLAGGIAHDFNNMLSVVIGYAEIGESTTSSDDPAHACFHEILTAAKRSADLTTQLLAFARRQVVQPRSVDLNAVVSGLLGLLGRLIGEGIELVWLPAPSVWPVFIDPSQVDRVLANLAANARDAMQGSGRLVISTRNLEIGADTAHWTGVPPGEYVELTVSDTGEGMDAEVQAHVFEPFFTTKAGGRGTGLGLATVFGSVAQNGGHIRVESTPGAGATFRVILPRHEGNTVTDVSASAQRLIPRADETILLVEDQEQILRFTTSLLERAGYHVLPAASPAIALDLAGRFEGTVDLVVTDVIMPGMHGQDLVSRLEVVRPGIRSIFMSGYTADVMAQGGVIGSGVHFLQKPFRGAELCALVREVLNEPRA